MPKTKITKKRVNITLDKEVYKILKASNKKVSSIINEILLKYYASRNNAINLPEIFETDNRMVPCSNHGQVISKKYFK